MFSVLLSDKNIQLPWLVDGEEFKRMLTKGEYQSYENRLSLGRKFRYLDKQHEQTIRKYVV